jgi:hypothetical protein
VITGIGGTYAIAALITAVLMLIGRRK